MHEDLQVSCSNQKTQIGEVIKGVLEVVAAKCPKQRESFMVLSEKNT